MLWQKTFPDLADPQLKWKLMIWKYLHVSTSVEVGVVIDVLQSLHAYITGLVAEDLVHLLLLVLEWAASQCPPSIHH